jgi:hypothetical protein
MIVYHRTYRANAIEREGFRDGFYVMPGLGEIRGVFVSAAGRRLTTRSGYNL